MKRRTRWFLIGSAVAVLFFVPGLRAGENISDSPSLDSWAPRAAADSDGNFYVVWNELYGESGGDLFFAKYTKSEKSWSAPKNISNSGRVVGAKGKDVEGIAVDGSNNVHVVWTEMSAVRLRTLSGGAWGTAATIGEGNQLEGAKIAALGAGNLYIVWWGNDGVVRFRARVNGNWETARQISSSKRSKFADIAAGNNSVMVTFSQKGSYYYNAVYMLRNTASGSNWSSPAPVAPEEKDQLHPDVEFLNGTTPQIIFCYENIVGESSSVRHCAWTGGHFGSPVTCSRPGSIHYPSLVSKGNVLAAVWQVGGWGNGVAVYYNYYDGGSWETPVSVPSSAGSTYSDGAIDLSGSAVVVWDSGGEIYAAVLVGEEPPPDNVPPVARFNLTPNTGSAPLDVSFNASASSDSDGTITAYNWVFNDGATGSGQTTSHTFAKPGTYTIQLTVVDDDGATDSITHDLEVVNKPPVAGFSINPETGIIPVKLTFDGSPSYDPDGKLVLYDWIFSDGVTAQGKTIERTFTLAKTYTVKLTVTDNFSVTAFKVKTFVLLGIKPPLNIRWESFEDSSLFMTRIVTDVQWEANPANASIAEIVKYRVFRKAAGVSGALYQLCGETDGATFIWRDTDAEAAGQFTYTVTAMDAAGHESSAPGLTAAEKFEKSRADTVRFRDGRPSIRK